MSAVLIGFAAFASVWGAMLVFAALLPNSPPSPRMSAEDRKYGGIGVFLLVLALSIMAGVLAARAAA